MPPDPNKKLSFAIIVILLWAFLNHPDSLTEKNGLNIPLSISSFIDSVYKSCHLSGKLDKKAFTYAMVGYLNLKKDVLKKENLLTIIDYTIPSTKKRWITMDLAKKKILFHTLVAHGKNSGSNDARYFSNQPESLKSCIGFFITQKAYNGKHGYSLKIKGLDKNFNHNAEIRHVVIHSAPYVSQTFINQFGRLGRSWGCPAIPLKRHKSLIDTIKNGSCLFIYYPLPQYLKSSKYLVIH